MNTQELEKFFNGPVRRYGPYILGVLAVFQFGKPALVGTWQRANAELDKDQLCAAASSQQIEGRTLQDGTVWLKGKEIKLNNGDPITVNASYYPNMNSGYSATVLLGPNAFTFTNIATGGTKRANDLDLYKFQPDDPKKYQTVILVLKNDSLQCLRRLIH